MLRGTNNGKFIHRLKMLGKEAELEQNRLLSEVNGCVHECPMDEDTTYVQPFYKLIVEAWRKDRSCRWHCHLTQTEVNSPANSCWSQP